MAGPALYQFALYRGDTRVWEHRLTTDPVDPALVGDPIDISGWVFEAEYRSSADSNDVLAADGFEITDGPGGIVRRTLTAREAAKLSKTKTSVVWDLQVTKPNGVVQTLLFNSRVTITNDVSR